MPFPYKNDNFIDGLVQDCSISSALAMEILQSCTKPSMYSYTYMYIYIVICNLPGAPEEVDGCCYHGSEEWTNAYQWTSHPNGAD